MLKGAIDRAVRQVSRETNDHGSGPSDHRPVARQGPRPERGRASRDRLEAVLADAWRYRLALVLGPAGSGKTTLLARFAASAGVPVGWYRAEM